MNRQREIIVTVTYNELGIIIDTKAEPRKKGKWQWCGNHHLCSECDEWALTRWDEDECDEVDILTNFCPNCGSYNGGEEE